MSSQTTKKKSTTKSSAPKKVEAFNGIIVGIFEDDGPVCRYEKVRIPKKILNRMVIHGMSAVHGGENMLGGLFGPLPLFEKPNLRYLIYSFKVTATNTKDVRITKHGRRCSVFLTLDSKQQRYVLNNHLSIEKFINDYKEKHWNKELDVSQDTMITLLNTVNEMVKIVGLRAFSYGAAGLIEYTDPQMILNEGIISIIDVKSKKTYVYIPQEKFASRDRIKAIEKIEEINMREYGSILKLTKIRDYLKFKKILDKYSIKLVK
ncbi:MAG: hypothetical protein ACTSXA_05305 [Candidatus Heimdallarchaeota archaeon]